MIIREKKTQFWLLKEYEKKISLYIIDYLLEHDF
jgi:hypothetical protein